MLLAGVLTCGSETILPIRQYKYTDADDEISLWVKGTDISRSWEDTCPVKIEIGGPAEAHNW